MEDKEKHINQKPDEKYPAPDVPVEDAWAQMKDMLDTELPVVSPKPEKISFLAKSWKFLSVLVILLGLLLFVFYKNNSNNSPEGKAPTVAEHSEGIKSISKTKTDRANANVVPDSNLAMRSQGERESSKLSQPANEKENSSRTTFDKLQQTDITENRNFLRENNKSDSGITEEVKVSENNRASISSKRDQSHSNKRSSIQNTDYKKVDNTTDPKNTRNFPLQPDRIVTSNLENFKTDNVYNVNFVTSKNPYFATNVLKNAFGSIEIAIPPYALINGKSTSPKNHKSSQILKNIHFGVHWNAAIPTSGYQDYFRGSDGKNRYYTPFIPGLWVSKGFTNGNELLLKLSAYQQYFGNNKEVNSSFVHITNSASISRATALVKVVGMSAAIQYNFKLSNQWSLGVGAQSFLQQKALLRTRSEHHVIDSLSIPRVLSITDSLSGIKHSSDQWKYLGHYHAAGNAEVIYKWNRFQLGLGVMVPFKSITNTSYARLRPVSGQVSFRWRIK